MDLYSDFCHPDIPCNMVWSGENRIITKMSNSRTWVSGTTRLMKRDAVGRDRDRRSRDVPKAIHNTCLVSKAYALNDTLFKKDISLCFSFSVIPICPEINMFYFKTLSLCGEQKKKCRQSYPFRRA